MSRSIGVVADLHFGRDGVKGVSQFTVSFKEMVKSMIAAKLAAVVVAGDLFHSLGWFTPGTFDILSDGFLELQNAGIEVAIIPGNHDYTGAGTISAVTPFRKAGIPVYTDLTFATIGGWNLFLLPWIPKAGLKSADVNISADAQDMVAQIHDKIVLPFYASGIEKFKETARRLPSAAIFHASLIGFSPCDTAASIVGTDFLIDPAMFNQDCFQHVVGGHFHRRQFDGIFGYVGAPERFDFGERGNDTGWLELQEDKRVFHELSRSRRFYQFEFEISNDPDISTAGQIDALDMETELLDIGNDIKDSYVKLRPTISRHLILDRDGIKAPFYEMGVAKVVVDPVYTDVEQLRSRDIKATMPLLDQFGEWEKANEELSESGELRKLLEFENIEQYPEAVEESHFTEAYKAMKG